MCLRHRVFALFPFVILMVLLAMPAVSFADEAPVIDSTEQEKHILYALGSASQDDAILEVLDYAGQNLSAALGEEFSVKDGDGVGSDNDTDSVVGVSEGAGLAAEEDDLNNAQLDGEAQKAQDSTMPLVDYSAHVQNIGWQDAVGDGATAGTTGKSLRMEAVAVSLDEGIDGSIVYNAHVQNIGWQESTTNTDTWYADGEAMGTVGQSLRIEAIQIMLLGDAANIYNVFYRCHVQDVGWMGWARNGDKAGTAGYSRRMEAIQILLMLDGQVPDGYARDSRAYYNSGDCLDKGYASNEPAIANAMPQIDYVAHSQNYGWLAEVSDGMEAGITGQGLRLEALRINLDLRDTGLEGSVTYSLHVQDIGWQTAVADAELAGTVGKAKRVEAIKIELSDNLAALYSVYYRLHLSNYGWMGWASDGQVAGSEGLGIKAEAIEIVLRTASTEAPGSTDKRQILAAFQVISDLQTTSTSGWNADYFRNALADIKSIVPTTDNLVIVGDLTEWSTQYEYDCVKSMLASAGFSLADVTAVMGNHEQRGSDYEALWRQFCANFGLDSVYYERVVNGQHFIVLGCDQVPNNWCGTQLSAAQLSWLDATLEANRRVGAVSYVFIHQPLENTIDGSAWWRWSQQWDNNINNALDFFNTGSGNCYSYACAFMCLARALGYDAAVISGGVGLSSGGIGDHAWVEIYSGGQTYVCDPEGQYELPDYNMYWVTYDNALLDYRK